MLYDLPFPCCLTTFSGKKCLSEKIVCAYFVPLIEILLYRYLTRYRFQKTREQGTEIDIMKAYLLQKSVAPIDCMLRGIDRGGFRVL
jgi:hypothetical protein